MFDATFDFHNLGLMEPNQIQYYCEKFLSDSYSQGNNYLLIITGNGNTTSNSVSMVKRIVLFTLKQNKLVKKFGQAQAQWGGSGAFEIWLKP